MFGRGLKDLKKEESDEGIDRKISDYLGQLKELDKQLSNLDKKEQLQYIDLLLEQANLIENIERFATYRTVNLVEHYKNLLSELESRRKEADLKLKKFEHECDERIKQLRENNIGKDEVKLVINEREDAKSSHDKYVEKIEQVKKKMEQLRDKIENTCREKAESSKIISENKWI